MQCKHNIIIYKGPPNLKVLASARVHGLEIANRPPPARARQQRYSFCLFKTLFAMALIGVVATIPFWRSEFTPTSFNEYGLKHLNDSNVMISKLQKRDLASVTESTTPPSAPIIEIPNDAVKEVEIYENNFAQKTVIRRIDGKEMTNEADHDVLKMAVTIQPSNSKSTKNVVDHDMEYKDDDYYEEAEAFFPVQELYAMHLPPRVANQSHHATTVLIVVGVVTGVLLTVIIIILCCLHHQRRLSRANHSNQESGEELIVLDAESIAYN